MSSMYYSVICVGPRPHRGRDSLQGATLPTANALHYLIDSGHFAAIQRPYLDAARNCHRIGSGRENVVEKKRAGYRVNNVRWLITVYCRRRWWPGGFD